MFIGSTIAPAVLLLGAAASAFGSSFAGGVANLRGSSAGPACDESFPLAPPPPASKNNNGNGRRRRLVAIPPGDAITGEYYETGKYYAPLCPDGRRIDIRELVRCTGDSCYDEEIGHCTFVCTWSEASDQKWTQRPTSRPTSAPEVTEHPLLMDLSNLPKRYRMDEEVRAAIIRYLRDKIEYDLEELGVGLELLDLNYPGRLPGRPHALPLKVKAKGPSDISDFALSYILQSMRAANEEIATNIKRLDGGGSGDGAGDFTTFQNVTLAFSTYDPSDLINGMSLYPTESPTPLPIEVQELEEGIVTLDVETVNTGLLPWWAWLIIVLAILLMCCCCFYCCRYRRNKNRNMDASVNKDSSSNKGPKEQARQQAVNVFMQNRMMPNYRKKKEKDGGNKERSRQSLGVESRRQSRGPPRSVAVDARSHRHNDDQTRRTSRDDQTRRTSRDDQTRRTSRTKRTHRTRKTRSRDEAVPTAVSVVPEQDEETLFSNIDTLPPPTTARTYLPTSYDDETAVSALPNEHDPPEEVNAMVLYNPQPNKGGRDPTYYTDRTINPEQAEPEGDKIMKKQSMFVTGAMMNEVHRERRRDEEARRESAARRRRAKRRGSMGRRLKQSFRWKKNAMDVPSESEGEEEEQRYGDKPSPDTMGFESENDYQRYGYKSGNGRKNPLSASEPEGLTSDEIMVEQVNGNKKKSGKKKKDEEARHSRRTKRRGSMGQRLKQSFHWKNNATDSPYDSESEDEEGRYEDEPPIETMGFEDDDRLHDGRNRSNNVISASEPEGLTSDEMVVEQVNDNKKKSGSGKEKKKSKKKKNKSHQLEDASGVSRKPNRKASLDKLKSSFNWRAPQNPMEPSIDHHNRPPPIDIDLEANDSGSDSSGILTNHIPGGREEDGQTQPAPEDNPYYRNEHNEGGGGGDHHHLVPTKSSNSKKKGNMKSAQSRGGRGLFSGIRRKSLDFVRDAISSDDSYHVGSYHEESEEDKRRNKHQQHHGVQRQGSYDSDSYESV